MMDFSEFVNQIKSKFNKVQLQDFDLIECYDSLRLASLGSNDAEGYQIFTPQFIVKQMTEAVGNDILDFSKTVLEPTSGDGAFTTYILIKRLETISDKFELNSLRALSTIYSIEMDKDLIIKQRSNIFTLVNLFIKERGIEVHISYFDMLKCIIATNFMWAMFNSDSKMGSFITEVAFKMPQAVQKEKKSLDFPVWVIEDDNIKMHEEVVQTW